MTDSPLMPPREKNITKKDQIIDLIAKGETADILNDEDLGEAFKELMKYELIDISQDKISLTDLGKEARVAGVKNVIHKAKMKLLVNDIPDKVGLSQNKLLVIPAVILLLIALLTLIYFI